VAARPSRARWSCSAVWAAQHQQHLTRRRHLTQENPTAQPLNRYDAAADFDPQLARGAGGASGGVELADLTWTGDNWVQLHPLNAPRARESFALAYDSVDDSLVLFGGEDQPAGAQYADTQWLLLRP
jgi:hypothetical protein